MKKTAYLFARLTWDNNSERCETACFPVYVTEHGSGQAKVNVQFYLASHPLPRTKKFTVPIDCLQSKEPSPGELASYLQQILAVLPVLQLPAGAQVIGRIAPIDVAPPRQTASAKQSGGGGSVRIALHLCSLPNFCAIAAYSVRSQRTLIARFTFFHVFAFSR